MRNALALAVLALAVLCCGGPALAIEQPKYTLVLKDGDVEVRQYAPYVVAEVEVGGDQGQAVQQGFRKLAGYIFGGNAGQAKIAMTAPVAQRPAGGPRAEGDRIAMTSPVAQQPAGPGRWTVQFMMPAAYTLATLPRPNDPDVTFRAEPAREMAVLRFSGVARDRNYREQTAALERWAAGRNLRVRGPAILAQYDPPWTPWFLRHNEVSLEIVR